MKKVSEILIEQVGQGVGLGEVEGGGGTETGRSIRGGVFEADCSKQICQRKKTIFLQMFLCLNVGGGTKVWVWVSDADRSCLVGV